MARQPQLSEHVFRSVRGWLHQLYPNLNIFIAMQGKDPLGDTRPGFRLEMASGPALKPATPGLQRMEATVVVHYAGEGRWDAHRVADDLQAQALPPTGRIPLNLYNFPWPRQPNVSATSSPGASWPGAVDVAVVAVDSEGNKSAPSSRVTVAPAADTGLQVDPREWSHSDLVDHWEVYLSAEGGTLQYQADHTPGDPAPVFTSVAAGDAPDTGVRLPFSGLRPESVDAGVMELPDAQDRWDANVTLRLVCDVPRVLHDAQLDPVLLP